MTDKKQPEALRLAALIEKTGARGSLRDQAAVELRRQYAEIETLRTGYEAARLEIESLKAQGDTALLDWLNENIFYREMGEWDAKYGHGDGYNMWVLFAPKGVQGSARTIIIAARAAQEGK